MVVKFKLTCLVSSLFCVSFVHAEEPVVLDKITFKAEGNWLDKASDKKVFDHAGARTILTQAQIDRSAVSTVKDAMKQIPGVQIQENAGTAGTDLSLNFGVRGLTSRFSPRSTVLMDGVPLGFAPYGQPQLSLSPTSLGNISTIDVVRGAGSVRFGPQNVGGIVNFTTKPIPKKFEGSVGLLTDFNKNGNIKLSPNVFLGTTLDNGLGLALLYSGTHGDSYRDDHSQVNINDIILKSAYDITDKDHVYLNAHRYDAKADSPEGLTASQYKKNPNQTSADDNYFKGHRTDVSARYVHQDDDQTFEILGYHTDTFRDSHLQGTSKVRMNTAPRSYKVSAIEPRFSQVYQLGGVNNEVSVGYRYLDESSKEYVGRSRVYGAGNDPLPVLAYSSANGGTQAHAFYVDNRTELGNWTLTPGLRFESIKTNENFRAYDKGTYVNEVKGQVKSNELLPNFSALYRVNDQLNVFANYGVSFGPQQYSQMAQVGSSGKAETTLAGLSPEKAKNYEIGTHYLNKGIKAEATVFYIDFDQELIRGDDQVWSNLGATQHKGVELGLSYDFGQWRDALQGLSVYTNATYTQAKYAAGNFKGKDIPLYSAWVGNLGVQYQKENWTFNTDLYAQSKQSMPGDASSGVYITKETPNGIYGNIPGYATVGIKASRNLDDVVKGLNAGIGVRNLFNQNYFTRSNDATGGKFSGAPRTIFLQTSLKF